jgi:hypothetical protein
LIDWLMPTFEMTLWKWLYVRVINFVANVIILI